MCEGGSGQADFQGELGKRRRFEFLRQICASSGQFPGKYMKIRIVSVNGFGKRPSQTGARGDRMSDG